MTPEELAEGVPVVLYAAAVAGEPRWQVDEGNTRRNIADAIRKGVEQEREACARKIESMAAHWPDSPLFATSLLSYANLLRGQ